MTLNNQTEGGNKMSGEVDFREQTFRIVEAEVRKLCEEKEALVLKNKKLKEEIKGLNTELLFVHTANNSYSDLVDKGIIMKKHLPVLLREFSQWKDEFLVSNHKWHGTYEELVSEFLKSKEAKKE